LLTSFRSASSPVGTLVGFDDRFAGEFRCGSMEIESEGDFGTKSGAKSGTKSGVKSAEKSGGNSGEKLEALMAVQTNYN